MKPHEIVYNSCIKAYNMPYKEFLKCLNIEDNYYALNKFRTMQHDFSRFFCNLDSENQIKFMEYKR